MDERFWGLFPTSDPLKGGDGGEVVLNEPLARQLGARTGERIELRLRRADALPGETALSGSSRRGLVFHPLVKAVASDAQFGRFSLRAGPPALNVFVSKRWLQRQLDLVGLANVLLAGGPAAAGDLTARAGESLNSYPDRLRLYGLRVRQIGNGSLFEVRSRRVFIDPPLAEVLRGEGIFTYFVNEIRDGNRATPYSMVTGMASAAIEPNVPWHAQTNVNRPLAGGLMNDEILLTDWEANDLAARPGDSVELAYFALGPDGGLEERRSRFTVDVAPPIPLSALDPQLMPDFPGLAEANECWEWDPGTAIDMRRLRKDGRDERYWREHRGTPKAVVSLAAAQRMWGNRFGRLTAVRFPCGSVGPEVVVNSELKEVQPSALGLVFRPVRAEALAAADQSMDFGWLFAGMSMFLIAAALLLTGLLFGLSIRQRAGEVGTLLAMGFTPRRARRLLLGEGLVLAAVGVAAGAAAAIGYGQAVLRLLRALLPAAMDADAVRFHISAATLGLGEAMALVMAGATMWLALRRQTRLSARELLAAGGPEANLRVSSGRKAILAGVIAAFVALVVLVAVCAAPGGAGMDAVAVFFTAGTLLLGAGIAGAYWFLGRLAAGRASGGRACHGVALASREGKPAESLRALAAMNGSRRIGRSLAVVAMLACGTFVIVAVGANWQGQTADPSARTSGTGGFALVAQTAAPIQGDIFSVGAPARREGGVPWVAESARQPRTTGPIEDEAPVARGFESQTTAAGKMPAGRKGETPSPRAPAHGVSVVPIRVHAGDEASCLNLSRPQQPTVWGADYKELAARSAFSFSRRIDFGKWISAPQGTDWPKTESEWRLLSYVVHDGEVPAIADATTLEWALGKSVGDELIVTDEQGREVRLRIVASLAPSILQGGIIISEDDFLRLYPSSGGYRMFLIDCPPAQAAAVQARLASNRLLQDAGLDVVRAADRLAQFSAVQNAYLAMFQVLGGLGVLLGTVGLGLVVMRNVMERRGELAMLRAVGFSRPQVRRLVLWEHWLLLAMGLACGAIAGLVAIVPGLRGGASFPWAPLALTVLAIAASGMAWTWAAAALALRGRLVNALRNE